MQLLADVDITTTLAVVIYQLVQYFYAAIKIRNRTDRCTIFCV